MARVTLTSFGRWALPLGAIALLHGEAAAQAFRVADINPGSGTSLPSDFARLGGSVLFVANRTFPQGWPQLWKSDGTPSGTVVVRAFDSGAPHLLTESGGLVFFRFSDPSTSRRSLWRSDGTTAGTFVLTTSGIVDRNVLDLVDVEGTLFFTTETQFGYELWKSDGTLEGTTRVASFSQWIRRLADVNGTLFFVTGGDTGNWALWTSDGSTVNGVRQLSGQVGEMASFQGQLFFASGGSLWKSDGTDAGTQVVKSVPSSWLTPVGGTLFFAGRSSQDLELWKSDGTPVGTVLVKDIAPGGSSDPQALINLGGTLLFTAQTSALGRELWRSDGTAAGTVLVRDIGPGSASGATQPLHEWNGQAYFDGNDGLHGGELWTSDGTEAGTVLVQDIVPGAAGGFSEMGAAAGALLFFTGTDGSTGVEPWALPVPPTPSLSISDVSVLEGSSGTVDAVLTVVLSVAAPEAVTVDFSTSGGTATAGSDYVPVSGTLTFAAGVTTNTVTVPVNGDTLLEPHETFFVMLRNAANALIVDGRGLVTITSDDLPAIGIDDVTVTEPNSGATTEASFTVSLSTPAPFPVRVRYRTADGTASEGIDYLVTGGELTLAPGVTTRVVSVTVIGDRRLELDETFFVNLANPVDATIEDGQGLGTIRNDDFPTIGIHDVSVTEGDSGTTAAVFPVTLSEAAPFTVTVDYATEDGTATAGSDYVGTAGRLTFAPGVTGQHVVVSVIGDDLVEPGEIFSVRLSNPTNATIADGHAAGTIINDDVPRLRINDVTVTEGDSGTTPAGFTVSLSAPWNEPVTVRYATEDGTATAGSDYTAASGTVTFPPGTTSRPISVAVRGDRESEPDETFFVNLSNPTNATIDDGQGRALIRNDDFVHPGSFFTINPCRVVDTRNPFDPIYGGPALVAGADRVFPLFGPCGIPDTARAISVNITVTQPTAAGNLRLYPAGAPAPTVSAINYAAGQTRGNNAILALSASGELAVRCAQASGTAHVILDVNGYFE